MQHFDQMFTLCRTILSESYAVPFQAVSTIIAVGTSHGIVLIFGEQCFEGPQQFLSLQCHSTL